MRPADVERGVAAASGVVGAAGLDVDDVVVLNDSNKLTLRLLPADVVARVAHQGQEDAVREVALARALGPGLVAGLDPRLPAPPVVVDGFVITFWVHHAPHPVPPAAYAEGLARLHAGMRSVEVAVPLFSDRVDEALAIVADAARSPALGDDDRALLVATLRDRWQAIVDRGAPEQVIHGEPHPGNVLGTDDGVRFVDLETCTRGPIEIDLAHVPEAVAALYPHADRGVLEESRVLVLAIVAAWRWDPADDLPGGRGAGDALLAALREGPPWSPLDAVMG